jgi:metal-dependent amidase/aminoacylase/carboxypeptidase family protein
MTPLDALLSSFPAAELDELVATRRDLHRHPELAFEERRTAGVAAARLRALGLTPREWAGRASPPTRAAAERGSCCAPTWTRCR